MYLWLLWLRNKWSNLLHIVLTTLMRFWKASVNWIQLETTHSSLLSWIVSQAILPSKLKSQVLISERQLLDGINNLWTATHSLHIWMLMKSSTISSTLRMYKGTMWVIEIPSFAYKSNSMVRSYMKVRITSIFRDMMIGLRAILLQFSSSKLDLSNQNTISIC